MTRGKSILGALVLCALALCAFGAVSASAEGLTAYTCKDVTAGTGEYTNSHCTTAGAGNFSTVEIPVNTTTEVTGSAEGNSVLSATIAGIKTTVTCTSMTATGHIQNVTEGTMMKVHGTKTVLSYANCTAKAGAKECTVTGITGGAGAGKIQTEALTSTTSFVASPEEHVVTFSPEEKAAPFTKFELGGASCPAAIKGEKTVTGSAAGRVPTALHSHLTFEGTVGGKLLFGEVEAEYSGTNTSVMKDTDQTIGLKTS